MVCSLGFVYRRSVGNPLFWRRITVALLSPSKEITTQYLKLRQTHLTGTLITIRYPIFEVNQNLTTRARIQSQVTGSGTGPPPTLPSTSVVRILFDSSITSVIQSAWRYNPVPFIYFARLMAGSYRLPNPVLHTVRSSASSFNLQYPLFLKVIQ